MSWSKLVFSRFLPLLFPKTLFGSMGVASCIMMKRKRKKSPQIHAEPSSLTGGVAGLVCSLILSGLLGWYAITFLGVCAPSHKTVTSNGFFLLNQGSNNPQMCWEFLCWSTWEIFLFFYPRMYDLFIAKGSRLYKQCIMPQIPALLLLVFENLMPYHKNNMNSNTKIYWE